jgi:threonine/homoserine/homoserine lactone efflux protein
MSGSGEFTTWVALAFAAVVAGICWLFSSSPLVLILAALAGAYLGYLAERAGRRWLSRRFAEGPEGR